MKKFSYIIIAALLATSMFATACNTVKTNDNTSDTESNSETDTLQPVEDVKKIIDSDMYSIYVKDGKYYMNLTSTYEDKLAKLNGACEALPTLNFANMQELLSSIKGGQLSTEQLYSISQINSGKKEFEICDIEKLLDFNVNEDIIHLDHIEWDGKGAAFILRSEGGSNAGAIAISNAEKHNKDVNAYCELKDDASATVVKFEFANGGENIIIEKVNDSLYKKVIVYTVKDGNKTFVVEKSYYSKENSEAPSTDFSDIPDLILIHAEEGGVYYEIHMMLLKADTTDEQLLEFGIKNK